MTWTFWIAIAVVIATVYALVKRYETRLVVLPGLVGNLTYPSKFVISPSPLPSPF